MDSLSQFVVLFRDSGLPADPPEAFKCWADDDAHAEEQCANAYPDADIVWVVATRDTGVAYADYFSA